MALADGVTRREFLHSAGLIAAASAAPSLAWTVGSGKPLRTVILKPGFANLQHSKAWFDGLMLALRRQPDIDLSVRELPASTAAQVGEIAAAAKAGAQLVVSAISPRQIEAVAKNLAASGCLFFNVEPGAQVLASAPARVYSHSLQLWQAAAAMGRQGVREHGERAAMLASFRESGYDTLTAFDQGVEASGGRVVVQRIAGIPGGEHRMQRLLKGLHAEPADFLFVAAHGDELHALQEASAGRRIFGPLPNSGGAKPEAAFARSYARAYGHAPDAFALLGFEAGALLADASARMQADGLSPSAALAAARIDGPRGRVLMNPHTRQTTAPGFVDARGGPLAGLIPFEDVNLLAHARWTAAVSGWTTAYAV